jgi:hypothetical protein
VPWNIAEALRWFLANKPTWTNETWSDVRERLQASMFENDEVKKLGLSGAQYGSAFLTRKAPPAARNKGQPVYPLRWFANGAEMARHRV